MQHHKDSTVGLYATDKDPKELFKLIFLDMQEETGQDGNQCFSQLDFDYYESYFKKGIELLTFRIS